MVSSSSSSSSSASSSSSSASSSDSSDEDDNALLVSKKMNSNDDDDDDDDGDDVEPSFQVNAAYASKYDARKRAEELTKHRRAADDDDSSADGDDSSESDEDEDGELLTPGMDVAILKTIQALRRGDERLYDESVDFFDREDDDGSEEEEGTAGAEKKKPKRYRDVMREQIVEQMEREEEGEEEAQADERTSNDGDDGNGNLAYDQEQRDIRRAFLESTLDSDGEEGDEKRKENDSDSADEDDWVKPKAKKFDVQDDEAKKLWEQELASAENASGAAADKRNAGRNTLADPKGEVEDGDRFLMEFMTHRKWMEEDADKKLGARSSNRVELEGDEDGDDDSLEDLERTDDFESKYNFRFEEAAGDDANAGGFASGASNSIVHYARGNASGKQQQVLRRQDESRKTKRRERKERKAAERRAKEEKLKRLKNARREELEGRMEQVRGVLGYNDNKRDGGEGGDDAEGEPQHPGASLGAAEEEMILKLMEGDYDPEKFERVMNAAYGDQYYAAEEEVWKSEKDAKKDLLASGDVDVAGDAEDDDVEERGQGGDGDGGGMNDQGEEYDDAEDDNYYDDNYDDNDAGDADGDNHREEETKGSKMDRKLQTKIQDELYKLDYEDIIGDMPTRFKYRTVEANDYGLSTREVLLARDSTLRQFVSLKRMAPYGERGEYAPGTKRRKRFRQMCKAEKREAEERGEGSAAVEADFADGNEARGEASAAEGGEGSRRKKKRRRQKKGGSGVKGDVDGAEAAAPTEDVGDDDGSKDDPRAADQPTEDKESEPGKKRRRRKKKGRRDDADTEETTPNDNEANVVAGEAPGNDGDAKRIEGKKSKKKKKEKKQSDDGGGGQKKRGKRRTVEGVSGARLAAYGI